MLKAEQSQFQLGQSKGIVRVDRKTLLDRELERAERGLNQSLQRSQIFNEQRVLRSASHSSGFVRRMEQKHERDSAYKKNVALMQFRLASKFTEEPESRQRLEKASQNLEKLNR